MSGFADNGTGSEDSNADLGTELVQLSGLFKQRNARRASNLERVKNWQPSNVGKNSKMQVTGKIQNRSR